MTRPKVFVLQPIMDIALDALKDFADVEVFESDRMITKLELLDGVRRCDFLFALGASTIDDEILDANPDLKGIATMGLWADPVFVKAATKRKIPVTIIPHLITKTTADLTVALVIGVAWRIVEADRFTRCGRFRQNQSTTFLTTELGGKKVGIIGLGEIGKEVAKRLRTFEMEISYTKRSRLSVEEEEDLGVTWVAERDDLLRESDFVVIMTTYNESTHKFIGKREFELMKPTAFFINSARGRIVDEPALIEALTTKQIAGAGLDVYWDEPPVAEPSRVNPELFKFDNVLLMPHIGSATVEARNAMCLAVVDNLRALVEDRIPPGIVNPELYGREALLVTDRKG